MLLRFQVPPDKLGRIERQLGMRTPAIIREALDRTKTPALAAAKARTRRLRIYDTGRVYRGWYVERRGTVLEIKNRAKHLLFVEAGRRAGARMPPPAALVPWVLRHFPVTSREARGLAFVIARNIARRGIRPRPVIKSDSFRNEVGRILRRNLRSIMDREMRAAARR